MKWAKARKHSDNYYARLDLFYTMLLTLIACLVVALVIVFLVVLMNPRVA